MLVRMWRKGNPWTLLVGMQTGIATMENGVEVPMEKKSLSQRDILTPMFIAALFIIAKVWKQPKCLSTDERIFLNGVYCGEFS